MLNIKRNIKIIAIALMLSGMAVTPANGMWDFASKAQQKTVQWIKGHPGTTALITVGTIGGLWWLNSGWTLVEAVRANRIDIVKSLLEQGVNVEEPMPGDDRTPLVWASIRGYADIAELLLEKGADFKQYRFLGYRTALHCAVTRGHTNVVDVLLKYGADPDEDDGRGYGTTVLMYAGLYGFKDIAALLLKHGADINKKRKLDGMTALIFASNSSHVSDDGRYDAVKFLVDNGAKIDEKNKDGNTALMLAKMQGHKNVAEFLLSKGAADYTKK